MDGRGNCEEGSREVLDDVLDKEWSEGMLRGDWGKHKVIGREKNVCRRQQIYDVFQLICNVLFQNRETNCIIGETKES